MLKSKTLAFSVSIKNCEVQVFRAGGPGGQNQNKTSSGVRVIHHPSGARGEARDSRTQLENKKSAFRRMAQTKKFNRWVELQCADNALLESRINEQVDRDMSKDNLKVEFFEPEEKNAS